MLPNKNWFFKSPPRWAHEVSRLPRHWCHPYNSLQDEIGLKSSVRSFNQIGHGGWGQMTILLTSFLSLKTHCVTTFWGRPHSEDVSLPPASTVAAFGNRIEFYPGHCPSDTGGNWARKSIASQNPPNPKNNTAWSGLNRKLVTVKQKILRLPWETLLWISLTWTHPDCRETGTHLRPCSTIKATSEPRPTLLTWVPLWTACLLVLIRRIASRWPRLSKAVSQKSH